MKKPVISSESPVMSFISKASMETEAEPDTQADQIQAKAVPEGYKLNSLYLEKRTRRVQLVMKPSLYDKVKLEAKKRGLSFNECVHAILEDYVKE